MRNMPALALVLLALLGLTSKLGAQEAPGRWSAEKANAWYEKMPWLVGSNYLPAYAINELEMWQADTFDPAAIDREMGWAAGLGFNSMRVFLHNIAYDQDPEGFLKRVDQFLSICDKHKIGVMFVLFDACWDPFPKAGKQRDPKPHVHNSGWLQCPHQDILKDPSKHDTLKPYVIGVVSRFKDDKRVQLWDIYNEPDNLNNPAYVQFEPKNKAEFSLQLIKKAFAWAREAGPSQPLSSAPWQGEWDDLSKAPPMVRFQFENSDVITFHDYRNLEGAKRRVENLKKLGRPILCSEYMARVAGSTFDPVMGYFKSQKVAAYNWGFVSGKSQTIYPWDSWTKQYTAQPPVWFHDIFHPDGKPYREEEAKHIRGLTGKQP